MTTNLAYKNYGVERPVKPNLAVSRTIRFLLAILVLTLTLRPCYAGLSEPIVWLDEGVSIQGYTRIVLQPVSNVTGETFDLDVAEAMTETMRGELIEAGLELVDPKLGQGAENVIVLKNTLVHYVPGNIGGRWIGFGGGAVVCILRSYIVERISEDIVGEIVVVQQVASGGLFSAGAEKSVPAQAAKKMVAELVKLTGVEMKQ